MSNLAQIKTLDRFIRELPAPYARPARWLWVDDPKSNLNSKTATYGARTLRLSCFPDETIRASAECATHLAYSGPITSASQLWAAFHWLEGGDVWITDVFEPATVEAIK